MPLAAEEKDHGVAASAKDEGQERGGSRTTEGRGAPKEPASEASEEATAEADHLREEAPSGLEERVVHGAERVADDRPGSPEQGDVLIHGWTPDASNMGNYVRQAATTLLEAAELADDLADAVVWRGMRGFVEDIQSVARRRPGLVILGAAAALFSAVPVGPTTGPEAQADPAPDQLEPAALDVLLRVLWPGDADGGAPAAKRQRRADSGSRAKRQLAVRAEEPVGPRKGLSGEGNLTSELSDSAQQRGARIKKTATRGAKAASQAAQSDKSQVREATAQADDASARASLRPTAEAAAGTGTNTRRTQRTAMTDPGRKAQAAKADALKSASVISTGPARRKAPAGCRGGGSDGTVGAGATPPQTEGRIATGIEHKQQDAGANVRPAKTPSPTAPERGRARNP